MAQGQLFIDGQWVDGKGARFTSISPASGSSVWEGSAATADDVDAAVAAAREAFPSWSALSFEQRIDYLERFKALVQEAAPEIAACISEEMGKPLWEAKGEAGAMAAKIPISIQAHNERCGTVERELPTATSYTRHKPHGVVAVYGPFNFPGHLPNGHIVPALLAGNTVVFKPSEQTPKVAERTVKLWEQAGLPKGVLNLVQGAVETGKALSSHPGIDGLFFTGSSRTGVHLSELFGKSPEKILALEMGGNNPLIFWDCQQIPAAAYATIQSAFVTSGQRCTCARRLIVQSGPNGDAFLEELVRMSKSISLGDPDADPQPFIGPVVSAAAAQHVIDAQSALEAMGGKPLLRSELVKEGGAFVTPGIIDLTEVSNRPDEEVFGPFTRVVRVESFEEAIAEANNTRYGLSAGLLCDDEALYRTFFQKSRAGIVNWNREITGAAGSAPFGGIGLSGNHRPAAYYAADYCSYPVASMESSAVTLPETLAPGIAVTQVEST